MNQSLSEQLDKSLRRMQRDVIIQDNLTRYFLSILDRLPSDVIAILDQTHRPLTYESSNMIGFIHNANSRYLTGWEIERVLSAMTEVTGVVEKEYGKIKGWAESEWQYLEKYTGATVEYRRPYLIKAKFQYNAGAPVNLYYKGDRLHSKQVYTRRNKVNFTWIANIGIGINLEFAALPKEVRWTVHESQFEDVTRYFNQLIGKPNLAISEWDCFPTEIANDRPWFW